MVVGTRTDTTAGGVESKWQSAALNQRLLHLLNRLLMLAVVGQLQPQHANDLFGVRQKLLRVIIGRRRDLLRRRRGGPCHVQARRLGDGRRYGLPTSSSSGKFGTGNR